LLRIVCTHFISRESRSRDFYFVYTAQSDVVLDSGVLPLCVVAVSLARSGCRHLNPPLLASPRALKLSRSQEVSEKSQHQAGRPDPANVTPCIVYHALQIDHAIVTLCALHTPRCMHNALLRILSQRVAIASTSRSFRRRNRVYACLAFPLCLSWLHSDCLADVVCCALFNSCTVSTASFKERTR
jgi:hypothetical protein